MANLKKGEVQGKVSLRLSLKEAHWLKTLVQNPLRGESLDSESELNKTMRLAFWNAMSVLKALKI